MASATEKKWRVINRPAGRERHELDETHRHSKRSAELGQGNHLILVDAAQQDAVEFHHFETRGRSGIDPIERGFEGGRR